MALGTKPGLGTRLGPETKPGWRGIGGVGDAVFREFAVASSCKPERVMARQRNQARLAWDWWRGRRSVPKVCRSIQLQAGTRYGPAA
ncbi:hypothetical protein [Paenibacillus sp. 843]|uniref:hypothetical protein n=1 Tax=Paenibacillus sp. 843 TaxID=3341795 RepID=UPI00372C2FCA